ncbi:hypothetical protein [Pragia fontium]|uniref:hypothetical protein n=1 Tax=Pragia fontium TaxID=82985 RepID=UPI00069B04D8|nr:hypothetical protein [Pragia fontium]
MYIFSPSQNAFYPFELKNECDAIGTWPKDGIKIEDSEFNELSQPVPVGKIRIVKEGQLPKLIDIPPTE